MMAATSSYGRLRPDNTRTHALANIQPRNKTKTKILTVQCVDRQRFWERNVHVFPNKNAVDWAKWVSITARTMPSTDNRTNEKDMRIQWIRVFMIRNYACTRIKCVSVCVCLFGRSTYIGILLKYIVRKIKDTENRRKKNRLIPLSCRCYSEISFSQSHSPFTVISYAYTMIVGFDWSVLSSTS